MSTSILQVRNLSVRYGTGGMALEDVSLDVAPGQITALLGPNGAGKTTVLRAVSGLLAYHDGRILGGSIACDGTPLHKLDTARRVRLGIAQVMEARRIFADLTVEENLRTGAYVRPRSDRKGVEGTLQQVLSYFPILKERWSGLAGYLSGGEQQMLAIGRALMASPRLLLLDEPSLGIAPKVVAQISDILRRINADGISILLVEQNATVALSLCHDALVLETGRVAIRGSAEELLSDVRVRSIYLGLDEAGTNRSFRPSRAGAPA